MKSVSEIQKAPTGRRYFTASKPTIGSQMKTSRVHAEPAANRVRYVLQTKQLRFVF